MTEEIDSFDYDEGYRQGAQAAPRTDFPLSDLELETYPPDYRRGYRAGYWEHRQEKASPFALD